MARRTEKPTRIDFWLCNPSVFRDKICTQLSGAHGGSFLTAAAAAYPAKLSEDIANVIIAASRAVDRNAYWQAMKGD